MKMMGPLLLVQSGLKTTWPSKVLLGEECLGGGNSGILSRGYVR